MRSTRNNDCLSFCNITLRTTEVCDYQLRTIITSCTLAKCALSDKVYIFFCAYRLIQKVQQIRIGIWITMRDIHIVGFMIENHFEGQGWLETGAFGFRQMILKILNIKTITKPANSTRLRQSRRIEYRFHAWIVKIILILEVIDIEPIFSTLNNIRNPKVKPLLWLSTTGVVLHVAVVFILSYPMRLAKITRFESALKN